MGWGDKKKVEEGVGFFNLACGGGVVVVVMGEGSIFFFFGVANIGFERAFENRKRANPKSENAHMKKKKKRAKKKKKTRVRKAGRA